MSAVFPAKRVSAVRLFAHDRRLLWFVGAMSIAAIYLLARFIANPSAAGDATLPPPKKMGVSAWGRIAPSSEVIALAPTSNLDGSRVESLLVQEGDEVRSGQTVAVLATRSKREANLRECSLRLDVARARLDQIKLGAEASDIHAQVAVVRRLENDLDIANKQFRRTDSLSKKGATTDEEEDNARWKLHQAEANLEQARAQLERLKTVRPSEVKIAELEVDQASAALRVAQEDLAATEVRSPIDGTVLQILTRPGQRIAEDGIVKIGSLSEMHAVAEVYEEDIGRVQPHMHATVRVPGLGWTGEGEVVSISRLVSRKVVFSNDPVSDTDARVVEVRIQLYPEDSRKVAALSNARAEVVIDAP